MKTNFKENIRMKNNSVHKTYKHDLQEGNRALESYNNEVAITFTET